MNQFWLVYCPHCRRYATVAVARGNVGFSETVSCVLCNRAIDAGRGRFCVAPAIERKQPKLNLLEVR
jgi:hypothetical protein